jgi:hypothetical protein
MRGRSEATLALRRCQNRSEIVKLNLSAATRRQDAASRERDAGKGAQLFSPPQHPANPERDQRSGMNRGLSHFPAAKRPDRSTGS